MAREKKSRRLDPRLAKLALNSCSEAGLQRHPATAEAKITPIIFPVWHPHLEYPTNLPYKNITKIRSPKVSTEFLASGVQILIVMGSSHSGFVSSPDFALHSLYRMGFML